MPRKPRDAAWLPPDYDYADVIAVQSVARGEANPDQQKRAMAWIINACAGTYELSFRSDVDGGERETAFAEGKRFAGMQVVKLVNMPPILMEQLRKKNG